MVALVRHLSNLLEQGFFNVSWSAGSRKKAPTVPVRQRQTRLTAEQVSELVQLYQAGQSVRQLAERFSLHKTTVSKQLEDHGIVRRATPPSLTKQQVEQAVHRHRAGESCASIARSFGVHPETVRRRVVRG